MNGQNQYDPARALTSHPTRSRTPFRPEHPERFSGGRRALSPILLVTGGALIAVALLTGSDGASAVAVGALTSGAWLSIVLGMSAPTRHERAGLERSRRLGTFRHELNAAGDEPAREDLERLLARTRELQLDEEEIADDLARIRASLAALDLRDQLRAGIWPVAGSPDPLSAFDTCHFICPVRFGRRRADQYGHLVLTRLWLKFRGALDMSVAWSEVSSVERAGRELIVSLQDSSRVLRFSCHTFEEAARGAVIAAELARQAGATASSSGAATYDLV